MAKGLGLANQPQTTSPVNPETQTRRRPGPQPNNKYLARRTPYYWQMQQLPSYGYGEYGYQRGKANNDSGKVPSAYLNYIER
jgi:hypothetical protein